MVSAGSVRTHTDAAAHRVPRCLPGVSGTSFCTGSRSVGMMATVPHLPRVARNLAGTSEGGACAEAFSVPMVGAGAKLELERRVVGLHAQALDLGKPVRRVKALAIRSGQRPGLPPVGPVVRLQPHGLPEPVRRALALAAPVQRKAKRERGGGGRDLRRYRSAPTHDFVGWERE